MSREKSTPQMDSVYFLKILLYFIMGSVWLQLPMLDIPLPLGLGLGLLFASHDHFQIDRKVEYAVLLVAAILSFAAPVGIFLDLQGLF